jgi:hypothetical protein
MSRRVLEDFADLLDRLELVEAQVATLNKRANESDKHLQSLIAAVERICDTRTGVRTSAPELPFEAELNEAVKRGT